MQLLFLLLALITGPQTEVELAKVYYYQKKYNEALDLLQKVKSSYESDLLKGDIYLAQKEYGKAEEIYKSLLTQDLEKKDALLLKLAEMYSWQKKYPDSLEIYQGLVARHPDDIQLRRKYAQVLMWAGEFDKAAKELEQSLEKK